MVNQIHSRKTFHRQLSVLGAGLFSIESANKSHGNTDQKIGIHQVYTDVLTSQAIECFCEQMSAITFQFLTSSKNCPFEIYLVGLI
jgi:hypothetical protein